MAELKLRLNLDKEEVELVVDGNVAASTGPEVFQSWVKAYNDKHKSVDEPVEEKVVDLSEETTDVNNPVDESTKEDNDAQVADKADDSQEGV